jgi:DNA-directed RNA polymerase specialized sigma24 family protein
MPRILVDRARARLTAKRDGGQRLVLPDLVAPLPDEELLLLDEAIQKLAKLKPDHAKLLELRCFAGLSGDEAASVIGMSSVPADWMSRYAKAWLKVELDS